MGYQMHFLLKITLIFILLAGFLLFGFYKARGFILGPEIVIFEPSGITNPNQSHVILKGIVKNVSLLYLNGNQIFTNKNGEFQEDLLLARGYNIIEVEGKDKFNRQTKILKEIILK